MAFQLHRIAGSALHPGHHRIGPFAEQFDFTLGPPNALNLNDIPVWIGSIPFGVVLIQMGTNTRLGCFCNGVRHRELPQALDAGSSKWIRNPKLWHQSALNLSVV